MHAGQYAETIHERHLNGLCGYPLCGNKPSAPYRSAKRFVVSTANRTITEKEGNDEQAFCGRKCAARSAWVSTNLGTEAAWIRGKRGDMLLLEDKEAAGEVVWTGRRGDVLSWVKKEAGGETGTASANGVDAVETSSTPAAPIAPVTRASPVATPVNAASPLSAAIPLPGPPAKTPTSTPVKPTPAVSTPPPKPTTGASDVSSLIASLSIVERETPRAKPAPPSAEGTHVEQGCVVAGQSAPLPAPPAPLADTTATTPARRAATSLLPTNNKLASTILSASKTLAVPESDSDSESEEEWAKEMGWGGGTEVDDLFAQARAAREFIE